MPKPFVAAATLAMLAGCSTPSKPPGVEPSPPHATAQPKITHFYPSQPVIRGKGGSTQLCYGTQDVTEVSLDPAVERVWPSPSRCFEVTPAGKTVYTLTASSPAGKVSQQLTIEVGPAAARIVEVRIDAKQVKPGTRWTACVKSQNVARWEISAGKWISEPTPSGGCFADEPRQTTTYTVRAIGALGEVDTEHVSVTVR